ncbi:MAG TPA: helicase [Candidatus Cloacimonetes bacterium]|nr:helicase [Candidatus Cloacimonadota bacterium]
MRKSKMAKLVTNQKEFLSEIIDNILPSSNNLYFLVGYFYFSGFEQMYKNINDKKMKILIGMNIEKNMSNKIKEFTIIQEINQSRLEIKKSYFKSFVEIFNDTDYFDSEEKQEAFRIFIGKMKDGSLEIRKTEHPNHAKLYLFEHKEEVSQNGLNPGTMITGSSNLTRAGLKGQHEINVILRDEYPEGKRIFDELWEMAIDIVNEGNLDEFMEEVFEKVWIDKLYKPYLFYIRILIEYFAIRESGEVVFPDEITEGQFFNLKYQIDAVRKSIQIIEQHNGVLISDVVGLGKSIIASTVAFNMRKKVIIIAPPHLHYQWDKEYRTIFKFNAVVFGTGSIHKAIDHLRNVWNDEEVLIIVDEAHKFRNENTDDYINLHKLCQGNKVMLLTATPFNNRPQDIFAMIKLFQIPSKSTIRTVDNLSYQFQQMIKEYKAINKERKKKDVDEAKLKRRIQNLAKKIRHILEPVIIRRSRIDLDKIKEYKNDLKKQGFKYVFAEAPIEKEYYLGDLAELYLKTLNTIYHEESKKNKGKKTDKIEFIGARYKPVNYLKDLSKFKERLKAEHQHIDADVIRVAQSNLADFMRRLLVSRFESSINAFKCTLNSMIKSMESVKKYYEKAAKIPVFKKGNLPDIDSFKDIGEDVKNDLENYNFEKELEKQYEKGLFFIPKDDLKEDFIKDLDQDLNLLINIRKEWFENGIKTDPKLENFKIEIQKQLKDDPKRKIVVFSEYADTAKYIFEEIKKDKNIRAFYYSSKISSTENKKVIRENFDASNKIQKDYYDIIIATDALSEGVNLNRAGTVFNYDIPYNPTRVIQRVGRINRIGKMLFNKLFIYNYFPTDIGEEEIRVKQISTLKKAMIDALLGEDTKVLTKEEELKSYFHQKYNEALKLQEQESWDTKYQDDLYYLKKKKPELIEKALSIPRRSRIQRTEKKSQSGVIIFGKKAEDYTFRLGTSETESHALSVEEAFELFEAEISEKPKKVSKHFEKIYQQTKDNMFISKTQVSTSGKKGEAINKIELLIELSPEKKDYFADLYFVAKELNGLPDGVFTLIRKIDSENLKDDVNDLIKKVPHNYLAKIIKKANKIDEGTETLILAEELI